MIFFWLALSLNLFASQSHVSVQPQTCEQFLELNEWVLNRRKIINGFDNFQILPEVGARGVRLYRGGKESAWRYSWRRIPLRDNFRAKAGVEVWYANGQSFQFIDVGFKNFEPDWFVQNAIVADHMILNPNENLYIKYGPHRRDAELTFRHYRWAFHGHVVERYANVKKYLTPQDLYMLQFSNIGSTNIDVFGLIAHDETLPPGTLLTKDEIRDRLKVTIQISYYGEFNFFHPTMIGALIAKGIKVRQRVFRLPFEKRLDPDVALAYRRRFYQSFKPETTCEFTRLAKFANDVPRPVFDRFILRAMTTADRRGMKTIVASGDEYTTRLFHRYGFKTYAPLPTNSGVNEYLSYLEIGSPEYWEVYERLLDSALKVIVRTNWKRK